MPTLAEVFNTLATRAGADANSDDFKALLTNPELSKIAVPDAVATKVLGGLHSLASAEATLDGTLRKKYHAEALNRTDENLYLHMKELGYDDALVDELKALPKTEERIKHATAKIKDLESKKVGTSGKEKDDLISQINGLKAEKSQAARDKEAAIAQAQEQYNSKLTDFAIQTKLVGYKYVNDKLPKGVNETTARVLLQNRLNELQGIAKFDEKTGKVVVSKQDGSELYDAQLNKVDFDTLSDQVLAQSNMIEVSGSSSNGQASPPANVGGGQGASMPRGNASFDSAVASLVAAGQE